MEIAARISSHLKRKQEIVIGEESEIMKITPLGAGSEVGRSCIVINFKGKTIMVILSNLSLMLAFILGTLGLALYRFMMK